MINNRFKIVKQIGEGRSKVFLCRDKDFGGKEVAVKFLPSKVSDEELALFRDEYFILQKLEHPNVVKAFEIGAAVKVDPDSPIESGSNFISLEYFDSIELSKYEFLHNEEKLKEILKQICSVLYYLHQSNYIYYDLKPENILVSSNSETPHIKLIDLGLAEFLPDKKEHIIKGTAQYIAPELLKQEPHDHRVDLYSLGILLDEILHGHLPFDTADELSIYKAQVERDFDFPESSDFSSQLIETVKKLLTKDPAERYLNSLQVLYDLDIECDARTYRNFIPAKVFSGRQDLVNILTAYVNDKNSSEVFTIKGFDGAGRSSLISRMYEELQNAILINNTQGISGIDLVRYVIKRLVFSERVFPNLIDEQKELIISFLDKSGKNFVDELHSVLSIITSKSKFIILIDDYNLFDQFAKDMIAEMIPIPVTTTLCCTTAVFLSFFIAGNEFGH